MLFLNLVIYRGHFLMTMPRDTDFKSLRAYSFNFKSLPSIKLNILVSEKLRNNISWKIKLQITYKRNPKHVGVYRVSASTVHEMILGHYWYDPEERRLKTLEGK